MPARVVDASVLAAIVFAEPEASEAQRAIGGAEMCAPSLLSYEISNVAWTKTRRNPELRAIIQNRLARVPLLRVTLVEVNQLAVFDLAIDTDLTGVRRIIRVARPRT